ncbi:PREDICTED: PHD and RING finger domain-containing protein 1-like [Priapulus caudatus]|uniref:PHD and RING finger domain-containing protein 1-like n=1 Tax=Priapulus caudatus TaxID=37621 RepID=A0ABM1EAN2_PRICU|nr:PREDICTED: PHD and RING finger domain-containing protein 1-like [Priapulus caudatus]
MSSDNHLAHKKRCRVIESDSDDECEDAGEDGQTESPPDVGGDRAEDKDKGPETEEESSDNSEDEEAESGSEEEDEIEDDDEDEGEESGNGSEKEEADTVTTPHNAKKPWVMSEGSSESESGGEEVDRCPVCLRRFRSQDIGTPESCDHSFCLECIEEWSKNLNTCPVDRQVFHLIFARHSLNGPIFKKITVKDRQAADPEEDEDPTYCELCGRCDREDRLLLCDGCDLGYHLECLDPPLATVPLDEWFCGDCLDAGRREDVSCDEEEEVAARGRRGGDGGTQAVPRTRLSERVRTRIVERRVQEGSVRIIQGEIYDPEDDDDDDEEEDDDEKYEIYVPGKDECNSTPTTSAGISAVAKPKPKPKATRRKKRSTGRKRKTTKKRKTTRRRKRTTKKKKTQSSAKSSSTSTARSARKKPKRRRRKRKVKRGRVDKEKLRMLRNTVKRRIASRLGLAKPPAGRSIPMVRRPASRTLDNQRGDIGVEPLHILGKRDELGFSDHWYVVSLTTGPHPRQERRARLLRSLEKRRKKDRGVGAELSERKDGKKLYSIPARRREAELEMILQARTEKELVAKEQREEAEKLAAIAQRAEEKFLRRQQEKEQQLERERREAAEKAARSEEEEERVSDGDEEEEDAVAGGDQDSRSLADRRVEELSRRLAERRREEKLEKGNRFVTAENLIDPDGMPGKDTGSYDFPDAKNIHIMCDFRETREKSSAAATESQKRGAASRPGAGGGGGGGGELKEDGEVSPTDSQPTPVFDENDDSCSPLAVAAGKARVGGGGDAKAYVAAAKASVSSSSATSSSASSPAHGDSPSQNHRTAAKTAAAAPEKSPEYDPFQPTQSPDSSSERNADGVIQSSKGDGKTSDDKAEYGSRLEKSINQSPAKELPDGVPFPPSSVPPLAPPFAPSNLPPSLLSVPPALNLLPPPFLFSVPPPSLPSGVRPSAAAPPAAGFHPPCFPPPPIDLLAATSDTDSSPSSSPRNLLAKPGGAEPPAMTPLDQRLQDAWKTVDALPSALLESPARKKEGAPSWPGENLDPAGIPQKNDLLKMIEAATQVFERNTAEGGKDRPGILKKSKLGDSEKQNGETGPDMDRIADMELEATLRQPPVAKQPSPELIAIVEGKQDAQVAAWHGGAAAAGNSRETYLKKRLRQERVIEEVKVALKPFYNRREIDKEEYKEIMRRAVPKVCHNKLGEINPAKIHDLVAGYIVKTKQLRKHEIKKALGLSGPSKERSSAKSKSHKKHSTALR